MTSLSSHRQQTVQKAFTELRAYLTIFAGKLGVIEDDSTVVFLIIADPEKVGIDLVTILVVSKGKAGVKQTQISGEQQEQDDG